jgi:CBS domain-containing protein
MKVRDVMTPSPATCEPTTPLRLVAQLMSDHDCAAIPIARSGELVGIVTDRDIACRAVAAFEEVSEIPAARVMTAPVLTIGPDEPIDHAIELMEENSLHHLPVIGKDGRVVGMIAQSDLGRRMTNRELGELARQTSVPRPRTNRNQAPLTRR